MSGMKRLYGVHFSKSGNGKKHWNILGYPHGARVRAWFATEKEAKAEAEKRNKELVDYGAKSFTLTVAQRQDAEEALQLLAPYSLTLVDAATAVIGRLKAALDTGSVKDAVEKSVTAYKAQHARDNISERHLKTFLKIAARVSKEFGTLPMSEMTAQRIENWLHGLKTKSGEPLQVNSRNWLRRYIGLILPIKLEKERSRKMKVVSILTPEEAESLMRYAPTEVAPFFAIGLWAGLRVSEIERLDWKNINLTGRTIDLSWFPTKTLQPRFVPVCDKLAAILEPFARDEGAYLRLIYDA
jgi:integrase